MGRSLPNSIDVFVGHRIRLRRQALEMSEGDLAAALGVAAGEIRKHERGEERVSAERLEKIAEILDVHFSFFFEDVPNSGGAGSGEMIGAAGMASSFLSRRTRRRPIRRVVPGPRDWRFSDR
ncbi:transcriptional regulator with XRE-family HTH domain [Sinorhizobium kostiense]|uniref:Transcriptional regulator with XRE-family HTH domain n=1 Tax=Sinorhizobium kostiense TaxID=76747 RepID=A0ABS4R4I8_9HYPH|nr:helix-turn-helix transcriptional regulator [Sinorhizobium kostiense]MBP2236792.1 transcriptional regulator with XRE-family HTH domain [Sinorhizobium kostiense]